MAFSFQFSIFSLFCAACGVVSVVAGQDGAISVPVATAEVTAKSWPTAVEAKTRKLPPKQPQVPAPSGEDAHRLAPRVSGTNGQAVDLGYHLRAARPEPAAEVDAVVAVCPVDDDPAGAGGFLAGSALRRC